MCNKIEYLLQNFRDPGRVSRQLGDSLVYQYQVSNCLGVVTEQPERPQIVTHVHILHGTPLLLVIHKVQR